MAQVVQSEQALASTGAEATKISVIAPTYNEADNVERLLQALAAALSAFDHEIVIVDDDSPDRTWEKAQQLARSDDRVRVIRRHGNRGLGFAVMEGFDNASGEIIACIDADLQHDPGILPAMVEALRTGADIAIGCRYISGGGTRNWNLARRSASWIATRMAQVFLGVRLNDPMSGYFMLRRADYLQIRDRLDGNGFKILLEIAACMDSPSVVEVAYTFGPRVAGQSKLSSRVVFAYLKQLYRLSWLGRAIPAQFVKFGIVGAIGMAVNLLAIMAIFHWVGLRDWRASLGASVIATISNYVLNNSWTFRHRLRKGVTFVSGYVLYLMFATAGLAVTTAAYVGFGKLATMLAAPGSHYHALPPSILLVCQFGAVLLGTFFNYRLNKRFTWGERTHTAESEPPPKARRASA